MVTKYQRSKFPRICFDKADEKARLLTAGLENMEADKHASKKGSDKEK